MNTPNPQALSQLQISPDKKVRHNSGPVVIIVLFTLVLATGLLVFLSTSNSNRPLIHSHGEVVPSTTTPAAAPTAGAPILTVSGYVVPHARIEISPRFQGTVKWIGVKKGDKVRKGDVMVRLEEDEYRARLLEAQGRVTLSEANLTNAEINLKRQAQLAKTDADSERALDDAKRARDVADAERTVAKGQLQLAQTYLDWCTIRAPIDGTILEKLVDPDELVVPQSFGGTRGPSTALVSLADLNDLQVEIDLNEADTPKVHSRQKCRISPEAYPDRHYDGYVFEVAPEANRQKGTLQVKVQVIKPDEYLTPELSAKVDFLAD